MKAILIDKTVFDAFVSLEDGTIMSIPINQASAANIGDTLYLSNDTIQGVSSSNSNNVIDKLIDYF